MLIFAIAVLFLASLGQGVTLPLLPALSSAGPGEVRLLGLVYAAFGAAKIVTQPVAGVWVDRVGGRRVLFVAVCLYLLTLTGFLFTRSTAASLLLRAAGGVSMGLIHPAVFALSLEGIAPERRGRRMSTVLAIGAGGMLVGPILTAAFSAKSLRLPLALALVPTAIVAVVLAVTELGSKARPAMVATTRTVRDELREMRGLFLDASLFAIVLPIVFNKLTFSAFQALLPIYGEEGLGLGRRGVSMLFLLTGVSFAAIQPVGGFLADRLPPRAVCLWLTPLLLAILGSMALVRGAPFFFVAYVLYIVVSSIIFVATLKLLTNTYGAEGRFGGLYGSAATLTDPFTVVGPVLFTSVYAGVKANAFLVMAGVGALLGLLFVRFARRVEAAP